MAQGLLTKFRMVFEGDPAIQRVAGDPVLSAELLLLFRMILADGKVDDEEMEVFRGICRDSFGIGEESLRGVMRYLQDFAYETGAPEALAVFRDLDRSHRLQLARHMAQIAKADRKLAGHEVRLLRRTLDILEIEPHEISGA